MKPSLAIVGASTRAAAASAVRAGFQPLAADLFADADLRRIATSTRISPYPEGFVDWMRTVEPPAWIYTGALENHPELVDQMAWIAPLWGNPGDVLARVRSPWELSQVLSAAGLLFPEIRRTADGLPLDGSWLAKTYQGASGSGVRVLGGGQGIGEGEEIEPLCYQERIDGIPCAAIFVATDGTAKLLGVTRQFIGEPWLGAHGFQYAGSIGPWPISDVARETLSQVGNVLADEFELIGLFGVDFMLHAGDVWTLEVNPRYTASVEIVERMTGVSAISAHAAACSGVQMENQTVETSRACGKATLFAKRDIVISERFAEWSLAEALQEPWPALGDVSPAGTPIEAGRPILTIFADGDGVAEVESQLRARSAEIEKRLY